MSSTKQQLNKGGRGHIEIDAERCKGCQLCLQVCPRGLIKVRDTLNTAGHYPAVSDSTSECTACGLCWQVCPDVAIKVYRHEPKEQP